MCATGHGQIRWTTTTRANAARHAIKVRGVKSNARCGVTRRGADGPARRSSSVSRAWWTGPPPIRSPRATAGRDRMARSPRRIPAHRDACGSWTRAWGQREPAHERTGRLKKSPARWPGSLKGGLDFPSTHARCCSLRMEHPLSGRSRAAFGHALGGSGSGSGSLSLIR